MKLRCFQSLAYFSEESSPILGRSDRAAQTQYFAGEIGGSRAAPSALWDRIPVQCQICRQLRDSQVRLQHN